MSDACLKGFMSSPLVLSKGFRGQAHEVHIQVGLVSSVPESAAIRLDCWVRLSCSGQSNHQGRVFLGWGKGDKDGGAISHSVGMCLMPHSFADLMGPRDSAGSGFDIAQDLSGGCSHARHMPQFGHVSLHGFEFAGDVQVLSSCQGLQELLGAFAHFLTAKHPGPAWVVVVGDRIDVGILLQVDLGAKDVVPQSEEEHPVALELRLAAPGHGERPIFRANLGGIWVGTHAPVGSAG